MQKIFEGNRGEIFLIECFGQKAVLKRLKKGKPNTLKKEIEILSMLQSFSFVPRLYCWGEDFLVMEYLQGYSMKEALRIDRKRALKEGLRICYELDKAGVWHKELGRYYHFIFTPEPKIIDFERSKLSDCPRNVLQFVGFYMRDFEVRESVELYKSDKKAGFEALMELIDV